jgi:hypothetical protein
MANFNTFASFAGGTGRNQIASQTLASTTETEFKVNTDSGTPVIAVLTVPQGTAIVGSATPINPSVNAASPFETGRYATPKNVARPAHSSTAFDNGRGFGFIVKGVVTPASNAANTLTLNLYCGTSKSGTNICTTGALTGTESSTQAGSFVIETQLFWDSTSQILNGQFWYLVNAGATKSYHVWQQNSNPATSIALSGLNFVASATWGNAAGGTIAVSEMSLYEL